MANVPTVAIKQGSGYAIINESDFDPKKNEKFKGKVAEPKAPEDDAAESDEGGKD